MYNVFIQNMSKDKFLRKFQIRIGKEECIHAKVFKSFQGEVSLTCMQGNKTQKDQLTYFYFINSAINLVLLMALSY